MTTAERIQAAYLDHLLDKGRPPVSVFKLCKKLDIQEAEFFQLFPSLNAVEKYFAGNLISETVEAIRKDEEFPQYSAREKLLAYYFTFFERALQYRSYLQLRFSGLRQPLALPPYLKRFRQEFLQFAEEVVNQAYEEQSLKQRPLISNSYPRLLLGQHLVLIQFYIRDESDQFQDTDAYIEKNVKLFFELAGTTPIDTAVELARFVRQNRRHA